MIFFVQFTENKNVWDENFRRFPEIKNLFYKRFKTSKEHPYDIVIEELRKYRSKLNQGEANISNSEIIDESQEEEDDSSYGKGEQANEHNYDYTNEMTDSLYENKIKKLLRLENRRKSWEVKIDNFGEDLCRNMRSIISLKEEQIKSEIMNLKRQIRTLKNRRF